MTLREQFQEWHDSPTNETVAENIIELEKIADDYAIEFAEWCVEKELFNTIRYDRITTKELIEIFKKQKGL